MSYGNNFKRYGSGSGADGSGGGNSNGGGYSGGGDRQGGGNRGNWNNNRQGGGGNGGGWKRNNNWQDRPIDPDPYIPVVFLSNAEPPLDIRDKFKAIAERLRELKFTVRVAGGNSEADDAARDNAGDKMEEYLPWKGFENRESAYAFSDDSSIEQACKFQPGADKMKDAAKKFLSRNLRMVQGKGLKSPAKLIIIWSEDGCSRLADKTFKTGNVGHMVSIAAGTKTPLFNIGKQGTYEALMDYLTPEKEPERQHQNNHNGGNGGSNQGYQQRNNGGYNNGGNNQGYRRDNNQDQGNHNNRRNDDDDVPVGNMDEFDDY